MSCVLLLPFRAAHADPGVRLLSLPRDVGAGDVIEIHWDALAANANEMELVLSLDGGRHFDLHVSPQLEPRLGRFVWRVPNLSTDQARLALRIGIRDREQIWVASSTFRIVGNASMPRGRVALREGGGLWDAPDAGAPPGGIAAGGPGSSYSVACAYGSAESPPRGAAIESDARSAPGIVRERAERAPARHGAALAAPRYAPLRN